MAYGFNNDKSKAEIINEGNAGFHNSVYRGKYLGSSLTAAQSQAITNGTFDDLFIGDYWTIGGVNYRIASFDYYYGKYNFNSHHAIIVPDTTLYNQRMEATSITTNGYAGSEMFLTGLNNALTTIQNAFGANHVLEHTLYFTSASQNGRPSGSTSKAVKLEIMDEVMVYGTHIMAARPDPTTSGGKTGFITLATSQLNLFTMRPDLIKSQNNNWYWLRDIVDAASFAGVGNYGGNAFCSYATYNCGVRPAFALI